MQIKDSRFHKVWEVKVENGFKKVKLGDSRKLKDGTFENWSWFDVAFVSSAQGLQVEEGDTITIISGQVQKRKYEGKYYDNVVVFEAEITQKGQGGYGANQKPAQQSYQNTGFQGDDPNQNIPF